MKSKLVCTLALIALVLFISPSFGGKHDLYQMAGSEVLSIDAEPTLQMWFDQHGYAINVSTDETGVETFSAGYYKMTLLAEIADYAPMNNLSWYATTDGLHNHIFYGENVTDDMNYFMADENFGLCLGSPEGYFYTETSRNVDEKDHALVFVNPNVAGYIVAWEDLLDLGDGDYQDLVLAALTPVNAEVFFCPRTLNLKSCGKWITAIVKFPAGFDAENVDISSTLLNGTIPANKKCHFTFECKNVSYLVLKFDRKAVVNLIKDTLKETSCKEKTMISLTITGRFDDGTPFQGTGKIKVIRFYRCCHHCHFIGRLRHAVSCRPTGVHAIRR
jgi:hypothetical protein